MRRYQPALLGGAFIGVFSALPIVGGGNACCCLWAAVGGMLTAHLLQKDRTEPLETGDAALGGLMAGVVGAVIMGVVSALLLSASSPAIQDAMQRVFEGQPQFPSQYREMALRLATGPNMAILGFIVNLVLFPLVSLLGSLLGVALFRKKAPPAPPVVQV